MEALKKRSIKWDNVLSFCFGLLELLGSISVLKSEEM